MDTYMFNIYLLLSGQKQNCSKPLENTPVGRVSQGYKTMYLYLHPFWPLPSTLRGMWTSQCLVMIYLIDTPSRCLESYIILTPANIGWCLDSFLFDMSADSQPIWWFPVHQTNHPAVCDMISGAPSFLLRILYHWEAVICSFPTVYIIYM